MLYHLQQKTYLWLHGEKANESSITHTLANGISTVGTKTLMFFQPGVTNGIEFLVFLYKSGLGYSAINMARSALSSILVLEDERDF